MPSAAADKLKVFAQAQRLMIISCLLREERNVSEIALATGIGQPALSKQLAELRRGELVRTRKEAKQVWYILANEGMEYCVRNMEAIFGGVGVPDRLDLPKQVETASPPAGVARFARIL